MHVNVYVWTGPKLDKCSIRNEFLEVNFHINSWTHALIPVSRFQYGVEAVEMVPLASIYDFSVTTREWGALKFP